MEVMAMKKSKRVTALALVLLLAAIVGCASTSRQESTGEYVDDSVITTKVKAAVFNDPALKSLEINVETFKGVVQLSGFVSSAGDIQKAIDITRGVEGVTSVKNDMRVKGGQ
jgi:osmotically-inducible protein OsmY